MGVGITPVIGNLSKFWKQNFLWNFYWIFLLKIYHRKRNRWVKWVSKLIYLHIRARESTKWRWKLWQLMISVGRRPAFSSHSLRFTSLDRIFRIRSENSPPVPRTIIGRRNTTKLSICKFLDEFFFAIFWRFRGCGDKGRWRGGIGRGGGRKEREEGEEAERRYRERGGRESWERGVVGRKGNGEFSRRNWSSSDS